MESPNVPTTVQELNLIERGPVQITEFGACIHDWIMAPCEELCDCLNCHELAFTKRQADYPERIKVQFSQITNDLAAAEEAAAKGLAGAIRWYKHHEKKHIRLCELITLLEDPTLLGGKINTMVAETDSSLSSPVRIGGEGLRTCGTCGNFGANVPIPCYTCMHFQPWLDGPHEKVYQDLLNDRKRIYEITKDEAVTAALDRTIIAVVQVILRCQARREELARQGR